MEFLSRDEILACLAQFPGTMYELAALSGISQGALLKIKRGESKPSSKTLRALTLALRIPDFLKYRDDEKKAGRVPIEYGQFMQRPVFDDDPVYMPEEPGELVEDEGPDVLFTDDQAAACREEIDALHALVLAQRKTIDIQSQEIARLKAALNPQNK